MLARVACALAFVFAFAAQASAADWISERPVRNGFSLAAGGVAASIAVDEGESVAVRRAAGDLASDVAAVTGVKPVLSRAASGPAVIVGTVGKSPLLDRLAASGKLDLRQLSGAWESFVIATVRNPVPGVPSALVIAGSDRRGTVFGIYEVSQAIGVSPWSWWADIPVRKKPALYVASGLRRFGPPSVKYRGVFLNDEDWGLEPWARLTHEPEAGTIGPKTYARLFELMLRLRANTVWPAMHKVSRPFNATPELAKLADDYGIVMGSSHAEPMLRNNVGEWKDAPERFNYVDNPQGVSAYWEERVRSNAAYESLWTLGMRGIHDSGIVGPTTPAERVALLEKIFADQRGMLARHVGSAAPQMFMPYKEVLEVYRAGLKVPEDVTIVWPDDNFGYIRQLPSAAEAARSGGSGVYYHLSYLGAPMAYLWLSTTPPALVRTEMVRAWDAGARTVWIANVGDLKPAEIGTSHFLELAWDVGRLRNLDQRAWLTDWAGRTFGFAQAREIGDLLDRYYRVNFERRPEHLQWWLPGERPRNSPLSEGEIEERLGRFDAMLKDLDQVEPGIGPAAGDAFFELVAYPLRASALANRRYFAAERYARLIDTRPTEARAAAAEAASADAAIKQLTRRFNQEIAGGKWRHLMAEEPADNQWRGFRISPPIIPAAGLQGPPGPAPAPPPPRAGPALTVEAETGRRTPGWRLIQGLGRGQGTLQAGPGAELEIDLDVPEGRWGLALDLLPTYPTAGEAEIGVSVDGAARRLRLKRADGGAEWARGVLDNLVATPVPDLTLAPGRRRIVVRASDSGVLLDRLRLVPAP